MLLSGSTNNGSFTDIYSFNITNPKSGTCVIPNNYFTNRNGTNKAQFTLEATNTGEINTSFMNGSKITSTISITRYTNLQ